MISIYSKTGLTKIIAIILCFNLFTLPIFVQAIETNSITIQEEEEDLEMVCVKAETDAEEDENGALGYGIGGFLCGLFGWLFATISKPKAPAARLVGKSENYVAIYSDCYEKKAKKIRTGAACTGWSIAISVGALIYLIQTINAANELDK